MNWRKSVTFWRSSSVNSIRCIDTGHRRFKMFIHLEEAPFHNCLHGKKPLGFRIAAGGNVSILLLQASRLLSSKHRHTLYFLYFNISSMTLSITSAMAASSAEQKGNASIFIVSDTLPPCKRKLKPWICKWISQTSGLLNHLPFPSPEKKDSSAGLKYIFE